MWDEKVRAEGQKQRRRDMARDAMRDENLQARAYSLYCKCIHAHNIAQSDCLHAKKTRDTAYIQLLSL